jgi:hypothetical protein
LNRFEQRYVFGFDSSEGEKGVLGRRECKTQRGGNPMNEANNIKEEEKDVGLTTATLASVGAQPEVRAVAASSFNVGGASSAGAATAPAIDEQAAPLFSPEETKDFRARWDALQVSFVDEPRRAVEQADNLVAVTMKRLAEMFAAERTRLEGQWDRGDDVSTEDLRLALRRYRSFFGRLLSV